MKRMAAVLLCCVLLCGCGGETGEMDRGMKLRSKLLQAQEVSFDMDISADYGDTVQLFSMACKADGEGDLSFTVTAPETISGITGKIAGGEGQLLFDETALHFGLLTDDQLSPVSAPWILVKTLRSGYLKAAGMEEDLLRLTIADSYADDALQLDIWLDGQDLPTRAEVLCDGRGILSLCVKNMTIV